MTHDEIQQELSAYALGALDPGERAVVEQHLRDGCRECEGELATWHEVVGSVALMTQETEPPDLKPQLLQLLRPKPTAKVMHLPRWGVAALAAAAVVALGLAIGREADWRQQLRGAQQEHVALQTQLGSAKTRLHDITTQLAAKEADLGSLRAALASAQQQLAIIENPGLQMVRLKETADARPAEAHVLMSRDKAVFYAFDLPMVSPDKAYELWWITEKEGPVNAGLFVPDRRGFGRLETSLPAGLGALQAAAVTIEPKAGVAKPSGPMVLIGKL